MHGWLRRGNYRLYFWSLRRLAHNFSEIADINKSNRGLATFGKDVHPIFLVLNLGNNFTKIVPGVG